MNLNFAAFALAATAFGVNAETAPTNNLRGQQRELQTNGFHETLGRCSGAMCGMWGDPHMVTCDGLTYDCQGIGIFTLMENHVYNIQANFVDVGAREHVLVQGWGLTKGASITNDIMIQYKPDSSVPVMQFGFGEVEGYEEEVPSEVGCNTWTTFHPVDMGDALDGRRTCEDNLEACRARCDANPDCTQFSYWADCGCHLNNDDAVMRPSNRHWPRALAGTTDSNCGMPVEPITVAGGDGEEANHGTMRNQCPLLMYLDGVLQDLSHINSQTSNNGVEYLYGQYNDDTYVELINKDQVHISQKLDDGEWSEIELRRTGHGPGELWSCHWDVYLCLPASQQTQFEDSTIGLLGTPNGNTQDDWMTRDGASIAVLSSHEDTYNYCVDNWCVSQEDSIMAYHGDSTYDDHKCEGEDHIDISDDTKCILSYDQIKYKCKDFPLTTRYACEIDCCLGGCDHIQEVIDPIEDIIVNQPRNNPETNFEYSDETCEDGDLAGTSTDVCPGSDIVKLLKSKGDEPLPADADVFYDITFGQGTVNFKVANPFGAAAKVFVKHEKESVNNFLDPTCEELDIDAAPCTGDFTLEVACKDYDDIDPFALVTVFFASVAVSPLNEQAVIDRCCEPDEYAPAVGIAEYTFEVQCGCPGGTSS